MFRVMLMAIPQTFGAATAFGCFEFENEKSALAVCAWAVRWPGVQALCLFDGAHSKRYPAGTALYETACAL